MRIIKRLPKENLFDIFIKFSQLILYENVWRSVGRICMWILELKGVKTNWPHLFPPMRHWSSSHLRGHQNWTTGRFYHEPCSQWSHKTSNAKGQIKRRNKIIAKPKWNTKFRTEKNKAVPILPKQSAFVYCCFGSDFLTKIKLSTTLHALRAYEVIG